MIMRSLGIPLVRLTAQTALLESEALDVRGRPDAERSRVAIAVNADSMAAWFAKRRRTRGYWSSASHGRMQSARRRC